MNITRKTDTDRRAGDFVRAAKSIAATNNMTQALEHAETHRASVGAVASLRAKASTPAATLADGSWAGDMADVGGVAAGFIESIRPRSVFYSMVEMANVFPLDTRVLATAALEFTGPTAEGAWLPVVAGSFDVTTLTPRKTGGIVVLSKELIDATDPASFAVLRREVQRAAIAAVDTTFLDVALDGITPDTAGDLLDDVETMLNAVGNAGAGTLLFVAGQKMAARMATTRDTNGARLFPEMGANGGQVVGLEVIVSDRIDPDTLALIDASGFAVNEGTVTVDLARAATLKMATNPDGDGTENVSMFQTNTVAMRVIAVFGLEAARADAVAAIKLGA